MIQSTHFRRLFSIALILGLVLTLINSSLAFAQPPRPGGENPAKTRSWGDGSRRAPIQNEKTDPLVRTERNDKSYTPLGTCHVSPTATGGPDEFGYTYIDSNEAGGPTFNWVDISGTGTAVALGDDDGDGPFPIGFTFNFYGIDYTEFYIASNGYLPMDGDDLTDFGNDCPVNDTLDPNSTIAVVWDDLVMSDGMAYYQVFDPCPVGAGACLVVEWDDARHFGTSDYFDFEAILYDNGDILMQFGPGNPELGEGSTTGIESYWPDGYATTYGLTYSCDTTNGLSDNLAVLFQYPTPPNPFPPPPPAPPDNDDCNTPTVIPDDGPFPYYPPVIDSSTATVAPDDPDMGCGGGVNQNTVWYEFTPPTDGYLSVHTFSSDYDTVLAIFDATPGCGALGPALACSDDVGFFLQSAIWDLPVTGGTTYLIEVADYGTIPGGGDTQPYFAFSPVPGAIGSHSSTTTHKFNPDNQAGFVGGNSRFDAIDGVNQLYWNWIAFRFGGSGGRIDIGGAGDLIQLANVALNDPTSVPGFRENTYTAYTAPGYIVYQRTFSNDTADGDDWAIVELTIKNVGSTALTDGRVFVYLDWDARGDSDFDTSGFEPETNLNYQEDGYLRGYVAGIAPVTPGFVGYGADYWPGPGTYVAVGAEMDAPSNNTIGAAGDVVTWEVFQVPTIPPGSSVKLAYVLTTGYSPSADMDAALKNAQAQVKTAVNTYRPGFSGWVFHDENGNGVRDPGEAGIPGALVTNSDGQTATTGTSGFYHFAVGSPGTYSVSVQPPTGFWATMATEDEMQVMVDYGVENRDNNFAFQFGKPVAGPPAVGDALKPAQDTYISNWAPFDNFGSTASMQIRQPNVSSGLVQFDLSGYPAGTTVNQAVLCLWSTYATNDNRLYMLGYPLLRSWMANEATWMEAASGDTWAEPGANGMSTDFDTTLASGGWLDGPGRLCMDVTDIVQSWIDGGIVNNGLVLKGVGNATRQVEHSVISGDFSNPDIQPTLYVDATAP